MKVVNIRGLREAPVASQSRMETALITPVQAKDWRVPPFQRPLRVNAKVLAMAEEMKANRVEISGVLTLGQIKGDSMVWLVDGQHRREAFLLSGLPEIIADLRLVKFASMAEMAEEFVRLNSSMVKMRPDDILRGLEETIPALAKIRKDCGFVGYDNIRRNNSSAPVLGMSALLRCWAASLGETPSQGGLSASGFATTMTPESTEELIRFLLTAHAAWGRDPEYFRLWSNLNLSVCMWLWRKLVVDRERAGSKRYAVLSIDAFKKCLMSLSASGDYVDWLQGRSLNDRDRAPCYGRLKVIFVKRLTEEARDNRRPMLPQPAWAHASR